LEVLEEVQQETLEVLEEVQQETLEVLERDEVGWDFAQVEV
jgi:hypothetical protein